MVPPLTMHAWLRYWAVKSLVSDLPHGASLLEVGAGRAGMGALLSRQFDYLGVEPDGRSFAEAELNVARYGAGGAMRQMRFEELEPTNVFDVVSAFEVLEHIEDDAAALSAWSSYARPNGTVLISVPANPERFGPTDDHVGHYRRYTRGSLATVARSAGLTVERMVTYGFPLGYALEAARNLIVSRSTSGPRIEDRTAASGRFLQPGERFRLLTFVASLPWAAAQRPFFNTHVGTGIVARLRVPPER